MMFDLLLMHVCGEATRGHKTRISIPGPENTPVVALRSGLGCILRFKDGAQGQSPNSNNSITVNKYFPVCFLSGSVSS